MVQWCSKVAITSWRNISHQLPGHPDFSADSRAVQFFFSAHSAFVTCTISMNRIIPVFYQTFSGP